MRQEKIWYFSITQRKLQRRTIKNNEEAQGRECGWFIQLEGQIMQSYKWVSLVFFLRLIRTEGFYAKQVKIFIFIWKIYSQALIASFWEPKNTGNSFYNSITIFTFL